MFDSAAIKLGLGRMADYPFMSDGGEMGALARAHDWGGTQLGSPLTWPESLKALVALALASGQPMFVLWGADLTLIYNDAYGRLLGAKHPSALGRHFNEVWAEAQDSLRPLLMSVFAGQAVHGEDIKLIVDRGAGLEETHFAFSYTPVRGNEDCVVGLFCICVETTSTVLQVQSAEHERLRLAQMFDQAPSFMALLEGPDHRFQLANAGYLRLIGRQNVVGMTVAQAVPWSEKQGFSELLDEVRRSGKAFRSKGMRMDIEVTPGGAINERMLDFIYQPVTNDHGDVTGIFVEGSDITERALGEAALRKSEQELRIALDAGRFGAWSLDFTTDVLSCSAAFKANFGRIPSSDFSYLDLQAAVHADDQARMQNALTLSVADNCDLDIEYRIITPADDLRWVSIRGRPQYGSDGKPLCISGVSSDITERKMLEDELRTLNEDLERRVEERTAELRLAQAALRQSQKMEAVGQLTGGIAHDFNNLLMGISGSLEMLDLRMGQGRMETLSRYVEAARGETKRAAALTQRLLAFSRRQTLDPKAVDLNLLIFDMEELVRRTVGPNIVMEVDPAKGLWPTWIDSHQFENALLNLCINARDAMPDGGRLTIATDNEWLDEDAALPMELAAGAYVSLRVTDTGMGMTPEIMSRAFDPFFTTKPMGQGTGLGLSMIYGLVRQSGGEVRIASEPDQGTTMCIHLPRYAGEVPAYQAAECGAVKGVERTGETILVVDDEPMVRMLITEVLEDAGYHAIDVEDGPAGLKVLRSNARIDLLITDVGLPGGMNGRQVADAGRALRPDLKVLFVTGYAENAMVRNGLLDGGMQMLTKPFAMEALGLKVRALIDS